MIECAKYEVTVVKGFLMKKYGYFIGFILLMTSFSEQLSSPKVLHMTFHDGCKRDFEDVAQELGINLTTWYVQALPKDFWEGFSAGNEIYNVGPRRAQRIWNLHKEFFDQFDLIVTSDTVPLSRIFLQNGWKKPQIIWICNRFDYAHGRGVEEQFPDRGYYELIRQATQQKNVRFVAYTPFEHEYMRRKGFEAGTRTIKPVGRKEMMIPDLKSGIPTEINPEESFFIFPRLDRHQIDRVKQECIRVGIQTWSGVYNGPEDLKQFKGVLFFPYAFSNLALFENLQRGIIHFVPTQRFLTQLGLIREGMHGNLQWSEWYFTEYADCLVYFDSWADLKQKVQTIDYAAMRQTIRKLGKLHRQKMLDEWKTLFNELGLSFLS